MSLQPDVFVSEAAVAKGRLLAGYLSKKSPRLTEWLTGWLGWLVVLLINRQLVMLLPGSLTDCPIKSWLLK